MVLYGSKPQGLILYIATITKMRVLESRAFILLSSRHGRGGGRGYDFGEKGVKADHVHALDQTYIFNGN